MPTKNSKPANTLVQKIVKAVRKDPQKAGVLTVLVAILAILQVRLLMSGKAGPSRAKASLNSVSDNPTLLAGDGPIVLKSSSAGASLRAWLKAPPTQLTRNLFAINLDRFPHDAARASHAGSAGSGFWDDLAKSMSVRTDVMKERQVLIENLQLQAGQLRLQSTVMGASPRAVINGEMVGVGDVVACGSGDNRATFRVLKIEARRILVEREGIKLEIQMK